VEWLVAGPTARHQTDLALPWAAGAQNDSVRGINLHQVRVRRSKTGQALWYEIFDAIE
jgi:hypothetical protein